MGYCASVSAYNRYVHAWALFVKACTVMVTYGAPIAFFFYYKIPILGCLAAIYKLNLPYIRIFHQVEGDLHMVQSETILTL